MTLGVMTPVEVNHADGLSTPTSAEEEDPEDDDENDEEDDCKESKSRSGNPVLFSNGTEMLKYKDLTLDGPSSLSFIRRYNSGSSYDNALGFGWSHNHNKGLYQYKDGSVVIRYGCGYKDKFVFTGGAYVRVDSSGHLGELVEHVDGRFTYTRASGVSETYDRQGRLIRSKNRFGYFNQYTYYDGGKKPLTGTSPHSMDPNLPMIVAYQHHLKKVESFNSDGSATGLWLEFFYNSSTGRLTRVLANDGRDLKFSHKEVGSSTDGNLETVTGVGNKVSTYLYDDPYDSHNITSIQEYAGAASVVNIYDNQDRVVSQTVGLELNEFEYEVELYSSGDVVETGTRYTRHVRNPQGETVRKEITGYVFDLNGTISRIIDAKGSHWQTLRNEDGLVLTEIVSENVVTESGPNLVEVRRIDYSYNSMGKRTSKSITLDSGEVITTSWKYDSGWKQEEKTVSSSAPEKIFLTKYTFYRGEDGNPINIKSKEQLKDDGSYIVTQFEYDTFNRLDKTILPSGQIMRTLYEGSSDKVIREYFEILNAEGESLESAFGRKIYTYDSMGRRNSITDGIGNTTSWQFDAQGRILKMINPLGEETISSYEGELLRTVNIGRTESEGDGLIKRYNYDSHRRVSSIEEKDSDGAWQRVISYVRDSKGDVIKVVDATGRETLITYDELSRVVSVTEPTKTNGDPGDSTLYKYDPLGNLIELTDLSGEKTIYRYDKLSRPIEVERQIGNTKSVTKYEYDAIGNAVKVVDPEENITLYEFDSLGRKISTQFPMGQKISYRYDDLSRLKELVHAGGGRKVYNYFPWGPVERIEYYSDATDITVDRSVEYGVDEALNVISVTDTAIQNTPIYRYKYDSMNRVDEVEALYMPGGVSTIKSGYDRFGNRDEMSLLKGAETFTHSFQYNIRNRIETAILPSNQVFNIELYPSGERREITYPNDIKASYSYENDSSIKSISYEFEDSTLDSLNFLYSSVKNLESITDGFGVWHFDYDELNRLTTANYPEGTGLTDDTFSYDLIDNRESPLDPSLYNYDSNNRLIRSPGLVYGYDLNGNMTSRSDGVVMTYDHDNRLVGWEKGDANAASYLYDHYGRRIKKTVNGVVTWFLWDTDRLIAELNSVGQITRRYSYLPDSLMPVQFESGSGIYSVHGDQQDTTRFITNADREIIWRSQNQAFGARLIDGDPDGDGQLVNFPIAALGQYFDEESGLHYNWHRYYDPNIGRYITADPLGMVDGPNIYQYALSNPLKYVDPFGLEVSGEFAPKPYLSGWDLQYEGSSFTLGFDKYLTVLLYKFNYNLFATVTAGVECYDDCTEERWTSSFQGTKRKEVDIPIGPNLIASAAGFLTKSLAVSIVVNALIIDLKINEKLADFERTAHAAPDAIIAYGADAVCKYGWPAF